MGSNLRWTGIPSKGAILLNATGTTGVEDSLELWSKSSREDAVSSRQCQTATSELSGAVHRARQVADIAMISYIEQLQSNCKLLQNGGMSGADFSSFFRLLALKAILSRIPSRILF
jgi:hypothetical protein